MGYSLTLTTSFVTFLLARGSQGLSNPQLMPEDSSGEITSPRSTDGREVHKICYAAPLKHHES